MSIHGDHHRCFSPSVHVLGSLGSLVSPRAVVQRGHAEIQRKTSLRGNRSMVPISPANSEVHTAPNPGIDRKILAILESLATSAILACQPFDLLIELQTPPGIFLDHLADPLNLLAKMGALLPVLDDGGTLHSHRRDLQKRAAL